MFNGKQGVSIMREIRKIPCRELVSHVPASAILNHENLEMVFSFCSTDCLIMPSDPYSGKSIRIGR